MHRGISCWETDLLQRFTTAGFTLLIAFSLCGCQSAPVQQTKPVDKVATTGGAILGDERLPTKQEELELVEHAERRLKEDEQEASKTAEEERHLKHKVKMVRQQKNNEETVNWYIKLGRFYRNHKRYKDALEAFQSAYDFSSRLEPSNTFYREAPIELGDEMLRQRHFDRALPLYERAQTCTSNRPEAEARLMERIAWVYRGQGMTEKAEHMVAKAKQTALKKCGADSAVYRVALIEEAVMDLDAGRRKEFDDLKLKLAELKLKGTDRQFAKPFMRVCAQICRKNGQTEQEDFLDERVDDFTHDATVVNQ